MKTAQKEYQEAKDWYLNLFKHVSDGGKTDSLRSLREDAIKRFAELGFPTIRMEEWKYTNVEPLVRRRFVVEEPPARIDADTLQPFRYFAEEAILLVFLNGRFLLDHSVIPALPQGVIITELIQAFEEHEELVKPHFARYLEFREEAFAALNTAFARQGLFIYLPRNAVLDHPIHILNLAQPGGKEFVTNPRYLFVLEENSQATILETHNYLADSPYFYNQASEIVLREGARLQHIKIQDDSRQSFRVTSTRVVQKNHSHYHAVSIDLGGLLVRNNLTVDLDGENAESHLYGFYLATERQHIDNHTNINHLKPLCDSNEMYKGILTDRGRGVFSGTIYVHRNAQKTNAFQSNKNLLLSREAEIDTKPQLKIFADDVKCSHGATIGQLDEEALFYLRQRGIGETEAHIMLRYAFAADVFDKIGIPAVKEKLDAIVSKRLEKTV